MPDRPQPSPKLPSGVRLTSHDEEFREHPQPIYDAIRERGAMYRDPDYGRTLLTRFDDVRAAVRSKHFSVDARHSRPDSYMRRVAATGLDKSTGAIAYEPPLVLLDDPDHRRIRLLVSKAFNPRSIEDMRPRIESITRGLLDGIDPHEPVDLIEAFAGPLPTRVILEMMGLSDAPVDEFKRWSEEVLMGYDPERDPTTQGRLRDAYLAMAAVFRAAIDARRAAPGDDLISAMVRAQEERQHLSDLEIISLCTQLMVAGNMTTTDLIGNGVHALLTHPEQLRRLQAEPSLVESAVEEMLRFDCPITETARFALSDQTLNGCPVPRGETLTASLAAANHDPAAFDEPHRFDITRSGHEHLAFGHGVHICLGAPLARLEGQIAIRELVSRFPDLHLDPERAHERRHLPFFRGFTSLPLRLSRPHPGAD